MDKRDVISSSCELAGEGATIVIEKKNTYINTAFMNLYKRRSELQKIRFYLSSKSERK